MIICCIIERSYNEFLTLESRYKAAEGAELELLCRSPLRHRSGDKSSLEIPQDAASAMAPASSSCPQRLFRAGLWRWIRGQAHRERLKQSLHAFCSPPVMSRRVLSHRLAVNDPPVGLSALRLESVSLGSLQSWNLLIYSLSRLFGALRLNLSLSHQRVALK